MTALLLIWLFLAYATMHAVCDYPLQGDFLSRAKNRLAPIPGVPFWQALGAHALIHAGGVMLVTFWAVLAVSMAAPGSNVQWFMLFALSTLFAVVEAVGHALIDDAKCSGRIGFNTDQAFHLAFKAAYVWAVYRAFFV